MEETGSVYRILDASLNRANEGLRTLEDAARFVLNHDALVSTLKELRHELATMMDLLPRKELLRSRDTGADVGTRIEADAEYVRQNIKSVVVAAGSRVQQSVRVIEEYSKVIEPQISRKVEQLRYQLYTACSELGILLDTNRLHQRLQRAQLYLLIDAGQSDEDFKRKIIELAKSEVDIFQLRDQAVSDRTLMERAKLGVQIAEEAGKLFIVNNRPDIAVAADVHGVHVGQDDLPVDEVRKVVGGDRLIGVSTHQISEAKQAVSDGADYIGCGPVFPSVTKEFDHFVGLEYLAGVSKLIRLPAFAIGGIGRSNVKQVVGTGFSRVAVASALNSASNPLEVAAMLKTQLAHAGPEL